MNTGISDPARTLYRGAGLLAISTLIAGCNPSGDQGFSFARAGTQTEAAQTGPVVPKTTKTTLARGAITLKAPRSYCIDETSVTTGLQGSSAMLAKCSSLDGKGAGADTAVMTVNISPRKGEGQPAPHPSDLAKAIGEDRVIRRMQKGQLSLVQVSTGGNEAFSPADPVHWRAATSLDTRLVLLGLFVPEGSELRGDKGGDLLASLARGISANTGGFLGLSRQPNNPERKAEQTGQPEADKTTDVANSTESRKKGLGKLIGRLLKRSEFD